ncbi:cytochrome P450 [Biscogniauxia mediterranea]|nr:cytochrome P450 [Biscogniauxia mediterranea]
MLYTILLLFSGIIAYGCFKVISAISPWNRFGQITAGIWVPLFQLLPRKYWGDVEPLLKRDWHYNENHKLFAKLGDGFIVVAPDKLTIFIENAEAIHQITSKREAFPKPLEAYAILGQYGDNVVTLEGAAWRMHRKVVSASFNEKNNALVFKESIRQTQGLIDLWLGPDGLGDKTFNTLEKDTASLMLNIIANIGFGLKILWPGQQFPPDADPRLAKYATQDAPEGHSMSFVNALARTLDYLILLLIAPKWLLKIVPSKHAKQALEAENNFVGYLHEFLQEKIEDVRKGDINEEGMDIMGSLVRTSYGDKTVNGSAPGARPGKKGAQVPALTDSEIIGNAFINIVAGHESTANVLHFSLAELAINPASQRRLQKDIDDLLAGSDPQTWDYEADMNALQASMVGACINEAIRLVPPVVSIPKMVSPNQDQSITMEGAQYLLPRGATIGMAAVAAQRNPRYWPTKASKISDAETDIDDFVPERWFQTDSKGENTATAVVGADTEDFGGFAGSDTSAQLYHPPRGSFIPFSDGARACLGRRIALVELVSALAVIFQKYSVELAVDEWANDADLDIMSKEEKAQVYKKAQEQSRETIDGASSGITLKLHGNKYIPMRLVRRGKESFESLRKPELELALDEYLAENTTTFSADPKLANYYASRARTIGSPIKKDVDAPVEKPKVSKRRATKVPEELVSPPPESEEEPSSTSTAVAHTPARALSLANRIPLPATPADVADAVDRSTLAMRTRVASLYKESGISEATHATRDSLSTVNSVLLAISAFELYFLRPEILSDKYAFTIPAISFLGTHDHPVFVPDLFLLFTYSFWSPALLWAFTSTILPSTVGYFVNLNAGPQQNRSPHRTPAPDSAIDPLTFSIVKALISFVVYSQGVTFGGWIDETSISRINTAIYGGYKGILVGTAISGILSIYDAVLKK